MSRGKIISNNAVLIPTTAEPYDVKAGKTAYSNSAMLTGTFEGEDVTLTPDWTGCEVTPSSANKYIQSVTLLPPTGTVKVITPTAAAQSYSYSNSEFVNRIDVAGDANLIAANVKSGVSIFGVQGSMPTQKEEESKTTAPNFTNGNYTVLPTENKVLASVTVEKPSTLLPENIKSGVTIGGIMGTYSEQGLDVSDTTATQSSVLSGYWFYTAGGVKTQGSITVYNGEVA